MQVHVRHCEKTEDFVFIADLWKTVWGGDEMAVHSGVYHLAELKQAVAMSRQTYLGAVTWTENASGFEIISIDATTRHVGVGTELLEFVMSEATRCEKSEVQLITTNDNLDALRFYQRRGFRIAKVFFGAVDEARKSKPSIPEIGEHGIPLHDELLLIKTLI